MYDFGARNYEPAIGRWMNIDPLAEKYESFSPYIYAGNVPTRFVDFDGKDFGIVINFEEGTITFTQTFYTDGNKKTNELANRTSNSLNSLSGKFGLSTKKDGVFTINFSTNVVEGENETDGRNKATADNQGNYFNIEENSVGKAFGVFNGVAYNALIDEGGDYFNFTNNNSVTENTFKHENLHALGASHQGIGGNNDSYNNVNERVIGAAFQTANQQYSNFSIKTSNYIRGDELNAKRAGGIQNVPKVKVKTDNYNKKNAVKLNGTIIILTN
ncbi:MAG: hypothetical protein COS19_02485 [Flavobacteriaceae bacterium CG02_land_8_20_14_3_00_34_13]|nr:MAG: hypothetical protein COS19_02485 [Flavobacteriaceae bacterium CG02_land_8_20_14_3_00_34_13]